MTSIQSKTIVTEVKRFSDYKVNKISITYKDEINVGNSNNISVLQTTRKVVRIRSNGKKDNLDKKNVYAW